MNYLNLFAAVVFFNHSILKQYLVYFHVHQTVITTLRE